MKKDTYTLKTTAIVVGVMGILVLLLLCAKEYRLAIHSTSGVAYFNSNPILLLWFEILLGMGAFALLFLLGKMIYDRDRYLTEAAIEIRKVTNNLHAGVVDFYPVDKCKIVYSSRGFNEIFGYSRMEVYNEFDNNLLELIGEEQHSFFLNREAWKETGYAERILRIKDKNGKKYWMQVTLSPSVHAGKDTVSAVFVDVTQLKDTQNKLVHEQERYRIATELSNEVMFEYDYRNDVLCIAEQFSTIYGKNNVIHEFLKNVENNFSIIHPDDRKGAVEQILHTKRIGDNDLQIRILDANGEYQWCRILYRAMCNSKGNPVRAIGKLSNISMYKKEIEELERATKTDSLTGAYNKMATKEVIDQYILKHRDKAHMLLMVDIDDFKKVNDNYGHQSGDEILMYAIRNLREYYKDGEIIGRVGGDEFVVFIGNVENKQRLIEKAQKLKELLQTPYRNGAVEIPISASLGVSMYPTDGKTYEELMFCADNALYEVKTNQKGNFAIYSKKKD